MKTFFNKFRSNIFVQGTFFYSVTNILSVFINYLFNIYAARSLGPDEFGEISAFFSYLILLTTPIGIVASYLIIKIGSSKDPKVYVKSLLLWLQIQLKKWWFLTIPFVGIIPFLPQLTNLNPAVAYILIPVVFIMYFLAIYESTLQGLHLFFVYAILGVVFSLIKLTGAGISYFISPSLIAIAVFIFLSFLVKLIISHIVIHKELVKTKSFTISKKIIDIFKDKQLIITFVSTIAVAIFSNLDIIYVKKILPAEDAGIYASWLLFSKVIIFGLSPLISLGFVFFSSKKHEMYHQLFFIISFILFALGGFGTLLGYGYFGRVMIDMLLGPKFYPVIPFLEWAGLYGTAYVMLIFMNNYYVVKGSKKAYLIAAALPIYIGALLIFGKGIGDIILINIWFSFSIVAIYLLLFFKARFASLWE